MATGELTAQPWPLSWPIEPTWAAWAAWGVVEAHRHLAGPAAGAAGDEVGVRHGGGAEHHAGHPEVQDGGHVVLGADAPAGLHPDAGRRDLGGDLRQRGPLVRHTGARRIEVDDVDPRGAAPGEPRRQLQRVAVARLAIEVALGQPHGSAVAQIDRRVEDHAASATKFDSRARPLRPDFSGWNWAPHRSPRATRAATGPP